MNLIICFLLFYQGQKQLFTAKYEKVIDKVTSKYSESSYQSNGDILKTNKTIETIKQEIIPETEVSVKSNKKQKIKFSEFVSLTQEEHNNLIQEYSESATKRMIEILNNYKGSSGKKYKSDYLAILNWVVDRYNDEQKKNPQSAKMSFEQAGNNSDCGYKDTL